MVVLGCTADAGDEAAAADRPAGTGSELQSDPLRLVQSGAGQQPIENCFVSLLCLPDDCRVQCACRPCIVARPWLSSVPLLPGDRAPTAGPARCRSPRRRRLRAGRKKSRAPAMILRHGSSLTHACATDRP